MKKDFIMDGDSIRNCPSNIAKMNIIEFIWYYCQMDNKHPKKPNIGWFLLALFVPFYKGFIDLFKHPKELLEASVLEFLMLIGVIILTLSGLGPILAIIVAHLRIKSSKNFINSF